MTFDIFSEPEQPKLYIADIVIEAKIPGRARIIRYESKIIKVKNYPIVLLNGSMPTKETERRFFKLIFADHISKGEFSKILFKIQSMSNIRFSSNLMYKFDYNKH